MSAVFDGFVGPLRLVPAHLTVPLILRAMNEASRGPLKGAVSAQKAFEGFDTETRVLMGGTEENNVSLIRGH